MLYTGISKTSIRKFATGCLEKFKTKPKQLYMQVFFFFLKHLLVVEVADYQIAVMILCFGQTGLGKQ